MELMQELNQLIIVYLRNKIERSAKMFTGELKRIKKELEVYRNKI
jgi:hypothetical protein